MSEDRKSVASDIKNGSVTLRYWNVSSFILVYEFIGEIL